MAVCRCCCCRGRFFTPTSANRRQSHCGRANARELAARPARPSCSRRTTRPDRLHPARAIALPSVSLRRPRVTHTSLISHSLKCSRLTRELRQASSPNRDGDYSVQSHLLDAHFSFEHDFDPALRGPSPARRVERAIKRSRDKNGGFECLTSLPMSRVHRVRVILRRKKHSF